MLDGIGRMLSAADPFFVLHVTPHLGMPQGDHLCKGEIVCGAHSSRTPLFGRWAVLWQGKCHHFHASLALPMRLRPRRSPVCTAQHPTEPASLNGDIKKGVTGGRVLRCALGTRITCATHPSPTKAYHLHTCHISHDSKPNTRRLHPSSFVQATRKVSSASSCLFLGVRALIASGRSRVKRGSSRRFYVFMPV